MDANIGNITFLYWPLLLLIPMLWLGIFWLYKKGNASKNAFKWNNPNVKTTQHRAFLAQHSKWLLPIAVSSMLIALARPQKFFNEEKIKADGIDIIMSMDLSASMLAEDFAPNRLEKCKEIAAEFVSNRKYDRIGLVVFSGESFTQSPLTTNHDIVKGFLANLQPGILEDGTAIGLGLATSLNALKNAFAKSKIIILLTDGENNSGFIDPITAIEMAKTMGVKVYTIGVGKDGITSIPVAKGDDGNFIMRPMNVSLNPELLIKIAESTGGKYYRAESEEELRAIYGDIDRLEKTTMEVNVYRRQSEQFRPYVLFGLGLILLYYLINWVYLKRYI